MVINKFIHAWCEKYGNITGPMFLFTLLWGAALLLVFGCQLAITIAHGTS